VSWSVVNLPRQSSEKKLGPRRRSDIFVDFGLIVVVFGEKLFEPRRDSGASKPSRLRSSRARTWCFTDVNAPNCACFWNPFSLSGLISEALLQRGMKATTPLGRRKVLFSGTGPIISFCTWIGAWAGPVPTRFLHSLRRDWEIGQGGSKPHRDTSPGAVPTFPAT